MLFYNRISRVPKGFAASAFFLQLKSVHRSGINDSPSGGSGHRSTGEVEVSSHPDRIKERVGCFTADGAVMQDED